MNEALEAVAPAEILIVDDTQTNLMLLKEILVEGGYQVRPALGGQLALRSAAVKLPDLILLDVKMPDMDGYEVCRALKADARSRDIPVIFISGLGHTRDKLKGFEAGGVDFITKPFQPEEVLARVETHLALRRLRQRLEAQNAQLQMEIAERKQAEEALRRSENTYRTIFENTGTALIIAEEDTIISFANTQVGKLLGYAREELEGKMSWTAFVARDDLEKLERNHLLQRRDPDIAPASSEFRLIDRQGNTHQVIANFTVIPETGKRVVSLIDVSELRKTEAELQRARKWESSGIFAGGIAHDFNNLLGIVLGNISLAQMCLAGAESGVGSYLKDAELACHESRNLTRRLIALTGGTGPVGSPQPIRELIAGGVSEAVCGSRVRCELDLAGDLWPVACDTVQIKEMIVNLAINARETTEEGGVIEVSARNEVLTPASMLTLQAGKYVHLSIKDHGKGIPAELLPNIFDPYFSTKERGAQKGMGLGLTMAYAVVKRHHGDISLESQIGVGTTFHVYLPACEGINRE